MRPTNVSMRDDALPLAPPPPSRHHLHMRRDQTQQVKRDLFATEGIEDPSPFSAKANFVVARRSACPAQRLPNAVKHLSDEELDRLLVVTLAEAKRRGRDITPSNKRPPTQALESALSLTRGQLNAVRAAFKAGITPARIARQFGLSQSDVRTALKFDK
jgi:hypothetical protein